MWRTQWCMLWKAIFCEKIRRMAVPDCTWLTLQRQMSALQHFLHTSGARCSGKHLAEQRSTCVIIVWYHCQERDCLVFKGLMYITKRWAAWNQSVNTCLIQSQNHTAIQVVQCKQLTAVFKWRLNELLHALLFKTCKRLLMKYKNVFKNNTKRKITYEQIAETWWFT